MDCRYCNDIIQMELLRLCHEEQECIIDQKKYQEICTDYNLLKNMNEEEEEELQAQLLEWFNNIGVCFSYHMNYNRQPLRKYKVLNPEWLTNAIYLLIIQGGSHAHNGVLCLASLQSILKHPEDGESGDLPYMQGITYSKEHCEYVCDVMRKYQLSYKTEEGEFIPALCKSERPKVLVPDDFDSTNPAHQHITYVMKYQYLPDTVVQRLMIRLKEYRNATEFWNKGLKITFTDMKLMAVIDMGSGDKNLTIDIYTTGSTKPHEFLPGIREHLRQINEKLNLTPEEVILAHGAYEDTQIKLATLLKYKNRNQEYYVNPDNDDEFSVNDLLDTVFGKDVIADYKKNTAEKSPENPKEYLSLINASLERILNERSKESESSITQNVIKALTKVQDNNLINKPDTMEDQFNNYVRDTLDMIYVAKDQTRAGQSTDKKNTGDSTAKRGAGEIDIAINNEDRKLALYEAQILESVESEAIKKHIDKLIVNYNPSGIQLLYHVVYARKEKGKFASFCSRYQKHLEQFEFPYPVKKPLEEVEDDTTALMRHMKVTLDMEGKDATVHFFVAKSKCIRFI